MVGESAVAVDADSIFGDVVLSPEVSDQAGKDLGLDGPDAAGS